VKVVNIQGSPHGGPLRVDDFGILIVIDPLELIFFVGLIGFHFVDLILGIVTSGGYIGVIDIFRCVEICRVIHKIARLTLLAVVEHTLDLLLRGISVVGLLIILMGGISCELLRSVVNRKLED
jgi:hypothetical protein